jgi:hypothetical protein
VRIINTFLFFLLLTQVLQMNDPNALRFTSGHLTDGYIPHTFGPQNTESYFLHLFQVAAKSVQAIRHQSNAFYVFNRPSHHISPAISVQGRDAWLLDYAVTSGGSVVPQQLWFPQGQGDRRRYVDQAQFRMPIFFVNRDGSRGVSVVDAAAGRMQLRGAGLPAQLVDKTTIKIRISVRVRSLRLHVPITHRMYHSGQAMHPPNTRSN